MKLTKIQQDRIEKIIKEEMDTLKTNNLEPKDVSKYVSTKVREMFFKLPV